MSHITSRFAKLVFLDLYKSSHLGSEDLRLNSTRTGKRSI
jgi:hypothetical protein